MLYYISSILNQCNGYNALNTMQCILLNITRQAITEFNEIYSLRLFVLWSHDQYLLRYFTHLKRLVVVEQLQLKPTPKLITQHPIVSLRFF